MTVCNVTVSQLELLFCGGNIKSLCVWSNENVYLSAERSQKISWKILKVLKCPLSLPKETVAKYDAFGKCM